MSVSNLHKPHLLLKRNTCTQRLKSLHVRARVKIYTQVFLGDFMWKSTILHAIYACVSAAMPMAWTVCSCELVTYTVAWFVRRLHWKLEFQRLSAHKIQVASFNFGWKLTQESGKPKQFCFRLGYLHSSQCSVPVSQHQVIWELFISADCETAVKLRSQTIFSHQHYAN